MRIQRRAFLAAVGASAVAGCLASGEGEEAAIRGETLTVGTTTSTYDTGILDQLNRPFEDRYGVTVNTVSQGTGAALESGRRGDVDIVMAHAPKLEAEFVEAGYGINRRALMYNDFVIVGAAEDRAGIAGTDDAVAAFEAIADSEAPFLSRGDTSGTHAKELEIWEAAGFDTAGFGDWYRDAGQGMGEILTQVGQTGGYTLADRGTYLSRSTETNLEIHVAGPIENGPDRLANPYSLLAINPAVHDTVHYDLAMAYIGFLTSPAGQGIIEEYTVSDEQLFFPDALTDDPAFDQHVPEASNGSARE